MKIDTKKALQHSDDTGPPGRPGPVMQLPDGTRPIRPTNIVEINYRIIVNFTYDE